METRRRTARRLLPPLASPGPFEGVEVLEEVQGALGLLLWQLVRDVHLHASLPAHERAGARAATAPAALRALLRRSAPDAELRGPLEVLLELPGPEADTACARIAVWARGKGLLATAYAFAVAAARLRPTSAEAALRAARTAVARDDPGGAEGWGRRAVTLARRSARWDAYTRALRLLAGLARQRGDGEASRRLQARAAAAARRHGIRDESPS